MQTIADAYLETQVMTAPPERLHLMVVDAAIRFARQGEAALRQSNYEGSFEALHRARECVNELLTAVRSDPNPELARQLRGLFVFVHRNLTMADIEHDPKRVVDALGILEHHRQTWVELTGRLTSERSGTIEPHAPLATENSWTT